MRTRSIAVPIAGVLLVALSCNCVRAEVRVQGDARDVRLDAHDATIAEILTALGERFGLRYRGTTGGEGVTVTFEGPLRRVVARVLSGYNYIIASRGEGLDVIVLSTQSAHAVVQPPFAAPTVPSKRQRDY